MRECDKISDVSTMYPSYAEVSRRGVINKQEYVTVPKEKWEAKHISANEKGSLEKAEQAFENAIKEFKETTSAGNISRLQSENKGLRLELQSYKNKNHSLRNELNKADKNVDEIINKVNSVLDKLPEEISNPFIKKWNEKKKSHSHDFEMEP